jgi:hypothetical protein
MQVWAPIAPFVHVHAVDIPATQLGDVLPPLPPHPEPIANAASRKLRI